MNVTVTSPTIFAGSNSADDAIWILTSTIIIFSMQAGFGLLESGSVSAKNEVNIMVKNTADVVFGGLTYFIFGYSFSFGDETHSFSNVFSGWGYFFAEVHGNNIGDVYAKFFFQASFATTATTIVSGAMAERCKLSSYIVFSLLNTVVYCFPSHWVWGSTGWLRNWGCIDVAGAGPVHLVGGIMGLVATVILQPRYGRFTDKRPPTMGSATNALLGLFMLWWGWLGFNCGSTFGISGGKWKLAARSAVTTLVASIGGGVMACVLSLIFKKRSLDVVYLINGVLGALVGITASCALVQPWESLVIGLVGALIAQVSVNALERLHIDDPVGCVGVHAVAGVWSLLAVGIFAGYDEHRAALDLGHNHYGVIYSGSVYLLGIQALTVACLIVWTAIVSYILIKLIDLTLGMRVSVQHEILGADIVEHGVGEVEYDGKLNVIKWQNTVLNLNEMTAEELRKQTTNFL